MGKVKQTLSILLAVAMVVTCVPQTGLNALAAEPDVDSIVEDADVADDVAADDAIEADESAAEEITATVGEEEASEDEESVDDEIISDEGGDKTDDVVSEETDDADTENSEEETSVVVPMTDGDKHTVTVAADIADCAVALSADGGGNATEGTDFTFTVAPDTGYKITKVAYTVSGGSEEELAVANATESGTYTIPGTQITADVTVSATAEKIKYTVTVTGHDDANLTTKTYTVNNGAATAIVNTFQVEHGDTLKLTIVPAENFEATVKVGETTITGTDNVYDLGTITADTIVAITAAAVVTSYDITETIKKDGVPETTTPDDVATITYEGTNVTVTPAEGDNAKSVKIAKNTDLVFKVTKAAGQTPADKVVDVSYQVGSGAEKPLTASADGKYTVPKAEITAGVTIIVNVRAVAQPAVTLTENAKNGNASPAVTYAVGDATTFEAFASGTSTATEGKLFKFKLDLGADTKYQIDKVTVKHGDSEDDPVVLTAEGGVYSFMATKEAPAITVYTSYDEAEVNSIEFKLDGDADSYKIAGTDILTTDGAAIDDIAYPERKDGSEYFTAGDTLLTQASPVIVTLTADVSYDITKVTLGTETLFDAAEEAAKGDDEVKKDAEGPYTITFTPSTKAQTLTVTTKAKAKDNDINVTFNKGSLNPTNVDYTVVTGETVVAAREADTYTIKAGESYLKFDVTTVGKYTPVVTVNSEVLENPEPENGKYSYTYLVAKLNGDDTIEIDADIAQKTVRVVYNDRAVVVTAAVGNTSLDPDGDSTYTVDEGVTLSFKVTALDNFEIDKITKKADKADAEAAEVTLDATDRFQLADVSEDMIVTITAKGVRTQNALVDKATEETVATDKNGVYLVSNTGTYVGGAKEGNSNVRIDAVELFDDKNAQISDTDGEGDTAVKNYEKKITATGAEITLYPSNKIAGKKLTLKLIQRVAKTDAEGVVVKDDDGNIVYDDIVAAEYKLSASATLNPAQVKIADIKQATDTWGEYKITANAGAEIEKIRTNFSDFSADDKKIVADAYILDGKLFVQTGFTAGEVKLSLYTLKDENKAPTVEGNKVPLKEVKITTTALLDKDATAAPAVKAVNSTDVSMTLSLSAKGIQSPAVGKVWYEVVAKANGDVPTKTEGGVTTELLQKEVKTYIAKTGDAQNAVIWVDKGAHDKTAYGTGGYCKYDVTVRLVHLKDQADKSAQTTLIADADLAVAGASYSKTYTSAKPFETKEPYYEDNLKLKKGTTTIYTGQTAVAATPQFGKNTSYMAVSDAYDITKGLGNRSKLTVTVDSETEEVWVSASSDTALGKHTIEVLAISTDNVVDESYPTMYASRATIDITVVRGIEDLEVVVPSDTLYKKPDTKTAGTMTATVSYNYGSANKEWVPKTRKVDWVLMSTDGTTELRESNPALYSKLTLKNGKVTVAKDYVVSRTVRDNQFKIKAVAMDYKVNGVDFTDNYGEYGVTDLSRTITITNDAMAIDSLAVLDAGNKVIARDGGTLSATAADGAILKVFAPGAPVKAQYSGTDLDNYGVDAANVKATSSNAKALSVAYNEYDEELILHVWKPAKNVTLTVQVGDGSNGPAAKKTMKLNVDYDETGELGLYFQKYDADSQSYSYGWDSQPDNQTPAFTDSAVAKFQLTVKQKAADGSWAGIADRNNFTNQKVTVKGGKIIYAAGDTVEFTTASKVTTITLKDSGKKPAVTKTYTLTNNGIFDTKGIKAPKLTMNGYLVSGAQKEQIVTGQFTNTVKADNASYIADFSKLYVKTDLDWTTWNTKTAYAMSRFEAQMNPTGYQKLNKDGSFDLSFFKTNYSGAWTNNSNLPAGTYKLKVNIGEIDEDGQFVAVRPATAYTLKVTAPKATAFKPTVSYKISAKDGGYAELTGKGNFDYVVFDQLQNANNKGTENKFLRYFELNRWDDSQGKSHTDIQLTDHYFEDNIDLSTKENKPDTVGYVHYTAYKEQRTSGGISYLEQVEGTVKITVNVTAPGATILKYAVSGGVIGLAKDSQVRVSVTDSKKNPVYLAGVNYTDNTTWDCAYGYNTIVLTAKKTLDKGKYQIPIMILPEESYYAAEYAKLTKTEDQIKFVNDHGVALTINVTANDLTTVNKGRITIDKARLTQTFSAGSYDLALGNYSLYVPYTEVYANTQIEKINYTKNVAVGTGDSAKQLIEIKKNAGSNGFIVSMNKALLEKAIAEDLKPDGKPKNTFYDAKGKAKAVTVTADVCYNAEGTQKDTFSFKLTMPAKRSSYIDTADLTAYEQAIDAINEAKAEIAAKVEVNSWFDEDGNYVYDDLEAQWDLLNAIIDKVGRDSGISFMICDAGDKAELAPDWQTIDEIMVIDSGNVEEPTSTSEGTLPIKANLKNKPATGPATTTVITFDLTLRKTETGAAEVSTGVTTFINNNESKYAVNDVTREQILTDLRAYMREWAAEQDPAVDLTAIRFNVEIDVVPAGFDEVGNPESGSVNGRVEIWNIHTGDSDDVSISYTIAAPLAQNAVIRAVKTAVGIDSDGNAIQTTVDALAVSNVSETVKADVLAVANKAAGAPYTVEYKKAESADVFAFTAFGADAGKISYTLVVKDGDGKYIGSETVKADGTKEITPTEITLPETTLAANASYLSMADAKAKVTAWIEVVSAADAAPADTAFLATAADGDAVVTALTAKETALSADSSLRIVCDDFVKKAAEIDEDGYVKGTIVLTKAADTDNEKKESVPFSFTLAKTDAWTLDAAATRVQTAVAGADIYISSTSVKTASGKAAVSAKLLAAAQKAALKDSYSVAIKQVEVPATVEGGTPTKKNVDLTVATGKVTLVLVITDTAAADDAADTLKFKEVAVEHTMETLETSSGTTPTPPVPEGQTASEIAAAITLTGHTVAKEDYVAAENTNAASINEDGKNAIITAIVTQNSSISGLTAGMLSVTTVTVSTPPTTSAAGLASVVITVTKSGDTAQTTALTVTIEQLDETAEES